MSCLPSTSATAVHRSRRKWKAVVINGCLGEAPVWAVYCCSGARLSALPRSGHLVPLLPPARWGAQAAGGGGGRGGEAGELRPTSAPHSSTSPARWRRSWEAAHCWTSACTVCSLCWWCSTERGRSPSRPQGCCSTQVWFSTQQYSCMQICIITHTA